MEVILLDSGGIHHPTSSRENVCIERPGLRGCPSRVDQFSCHPIEMEHLQNASEEDSIVPYTILKCIRGGLDCSIHYTEMHQEDSIVPYTILKCIRRTQLFHTILCSNPYFFAVFAENILQALCKINLYTHTYVNAHICINYAI